MIMPIFVIAATWSITLLNITHVINSMDPVNSVLLALAATIFALRYSIRNKTKKKSLSLRALYEPKN